MAGVLQSANDAYYPRAPEHTTVLGSMSVYQIFRNCQYLNDVRIRTYDLGTLTTCFITLLSLEIDMQ